MAKFIKIKVVNPCGEKWDSMEPNAEGSFCKSCKKTVVDFTAMTGHQLMEYFKNNSGGGCGRFYDHQLFNPIPLPGKRIPWLKYFIRISLPALLISCKVNAQKILRRYEAPVEVLNKNFQPPISIPRFYNLPGRLVDSRGEAVPFASVGIEGAGMQATTDIKGDFNLHICKTDSNISVMALGYESRLIKITENAAHSPLVIIMNRIAELSTVVITAGAYSSSVHRKKTVTRVKNAEKKSIFNPVKIFPNPMNRNGSLVISWEKPVGNDQQILIYNTEAVILDRQTLHIDKFVMQAEIRPVLLRAGNYIMKVTDLKTTKEQSLQFVVE